MLDDWLGIIEQLLNDGDLDVTEETRQMHTPHGYTQHIPIRRDIHIRTYIKTELYDLLQVNFIHWLNDWFRAGTRITVGGYQDVFMTRMELVPDHTMPGYGLRIEFYVGDMEEHCYEHHQTMAMNAHRVRPYIRNNDSADALNYALSQFPRRSAFVDVTPEPEVYFEEDLFEI